ncbi:MAG: hypothetical protein VZR09_04545 [Candidatus Gastranaerophilaceae bacterium]|nr:hypothetical protein [Candidatus Gastranaerophilaceae bacterium]
MTEVHSIPEKFTTIQYVTKDGEKCTATKNNGVVTVVGDKNGVRQIPLNDFMKEFVENLPKVDLARTPNKDTVQFSGQPEKTSEETPKTEVKEEAKEITEDKPNHLKKYLLTGAGALAVIGTGLYFFGRGKWWSKAAKNLETKGQELVDDARQTLKNGGKKEPVAEPPKPEAPKTEAVKPKSETSVTEISEEEVIITGKPVHKQPEIKTPKSPIPQEEIGQLPKDLETDVKKIATMGKKMLDGRMIVVDTKRGFSRHYYLNADKTKIQRVEDFDYTRKGEVNFTPDRIIEFDKQTGQPSKIINRVDGMEDVIIDLKPEAPSVTPKKPEAPKPQQPKTEQPKVEQPKPETPKQEAPKTETVKPKAETSIHPKSPIPQEQIFEIPKDLELDGAKIIKNGKAEKGGTIHGRRYTIKSPDGKTDLVYNIVPGQRITQISEYAPNSIAPFRTFEIQHGQVRSITDNTTGSIHKKFFEVKKPETPQTTSFTDILRETAQRSNQRSVQPKTPKQGKTETAKPNNKNEKPVEKPAEQKTKREENIKQQEEFNRQQEELKRQQDALARQQEEDTNNVIIASAALADPAISGATRQVAETAERVLKPEPIKVPKEALEELAADLKLKPTEAVEDGAQAAENLFGPKAGDDLFAHNPAKPKTTNVADEASDFTQTSKIEYEEPKLTSYEDDIDNILKDIDPDGSLEADFNSHNFGMDEFDSGIDNMTSSIDDLSGGFDDFSEGFFG